MTPGTPHLISRHNWRDKTVVLSRADGSSWRMEIECRCGSWEKIFRLMSEWWGRFNLKHRINP